MVVNESFNQGTPVIVTDAVGAASGGLVQDGVNGYIVKDSNIDELSLALCRILDNTQSRNAFGKNAQSIIAGWDSEAMVLGFRQAVDYVTRTHVVKNG